MKQLATIAAALALPLVPAHAPAPKPPQYAAADFRAVDPQNLLVIDTTKGRIIVEMYPQIAPLSVARIKTLARAKFYDGLTFHRVIDDFMAQGGDPKGDGSGGSSLPNVDAEFSIRRDPDTPFVTVIDGAGPQDGFVGAMPMRSQNENLMVMMADGKVAAWGLWCPGVAGMARAGDPNSANSQFFLMRQMNDMLEQQYTPWGRALVGEDVVRALAVGEPPAQPDKMNTVRVMADLPVAEQTKIQVLDTHSAAFRALVAYDKSVHGDSFSVCDVDLPVRTS